jgi:3',5'-cyclic-nucleotide phosphodiesterase
VRAFAFRQTAACVARLAAEREAPSEEQLRALDVVRRERAAELEAVFDEVRRANEPTVLPKESGTLLKRLVTRLWRDRRGVQAPLIFEEEFRLLSIEQGSLSPEERVEIQSHVSQTFRFLSSIPWTPDLARIPEIAHAHHEKLDGSGYPRRLASDAIPVPSRILTVCDIYDALTASDRPYKKAVTRDDAFAILEADARHGKLDAWLVKAFIEEKVWISPGTF